MEILCLARLDTLRGPLFLFDSSAVKAVLETLPNVLKLVGGVTLQSSPGLMPETASVVGDGARFEGFTVAEWANHAKKKSSLASRICKHNGELKAQIAS